MGGALKRRLLEQAARRRSRRSRGQPRRACGRSWALSHARCAGSSHLASGEPCQDWAEAVRLDEDTVAVSLADGAGSAKYSHYGANLVATRAPRLIAEHFDEAFRDGDGFGQRLVGQIQLEIRALAKVGIDLPEEERRRNGVAGRDRQLLVPCDVRDLSCTMLCVVAKGGRYVAVHVGDGVVGMEYEAGGVKRLAVLSHPDNGEFANETRFVTSGSASERVKVVRGRIDGGWRTVSGFVLMSDGPEAALYDKRQRALASACSKLLEACRRSGDGEMDEQLESTLSGVIAKKTSDDCSIALMAVRD